MGKTGNVLKDKPYGEIWNDHLTRMLDAGYTPADAARSHRLWKSLGKKAAKGLL